MIRRKGKEACSMPRLSHADSKSSSRKSFALRNSRRFLTSASRYSRAVSLSHPQEVHILSMIYCFHHYFYLVFVLEPDKSCTVVRSISSSQLMQRAPSSKGPSISYKSWECLSSTTRWRSFPKNCILRTRHS